MIKKYSMLKIAKQDFTNETWEEFSSKHNLFWNKKIITDLAAGFWELFQWGEPEYDEFAEAYFEAIPKTYKKTLFPRKLIKEYVTLESYEDPEKDRLYKHLLTIIAGEIETAVNRDKEAWNKTPTLPGLNPRGRKPGSPNKLLEPTPTGLPLFTAREINAFTDSITGASHKEIQKILQEIFPVSDEKSEAFFDGSEDLTEQEQALSVLSWIYQADLEVAAKEGSPEEVRDLLKEMNASRKLSVQSLLEKYENLQNKSPYQIPKENPFTYIDKQKGVVKKDTSKFTPAKEYLEYLKQTKPLRENQ